jgi:transposase-like protein
MNKRKFYVLHRYLTYQVSYRYLEEMMAERGVSEHLPPVLEINTLIGG